MKLKLKKKQVDKPKYDPLLFGWDHEERIVAVEQDQKDGFVQVWSRDENDVLHSRNEKAKYVFYTTKRAYKELIDLCYDEDLDVFELDGDAPFKYLMESPNKNTMYWFRNNAPSSEDVYIVKPRSSYLLKSGKTLFKGMKYDDVVRMYFDLEVLTTEGFNFVNSNRDGDKICMIPVITNRGHRYCLVLNDKGSTFTPEVTKFLYNDKSAKFQVFNSEPELIKAFIDLLQQIDPDVLANHNIYNFDLEYLRGRCNYHDIAFEIGRNFTVPYSYKSAVSIADRQRELMVCEIEGRHVIDTEILLRQADAVKREFPSYALKKFMSYAGKERPDRTHVEGKDITATYYNDPIKLIKYALDDVEDARYLDVTYGKSAFNSTVFTPYTYQDCFRLATGGKSESLFVRYYYSQGQSLPQPEPKVKYGGGYANVFRFGIIDEATVYADVESLYPSVAIAMEVNPPSDVLGFFTKIIKLIKAYRVAIKHSIEKNPELRDELKSFDGAIKIYLNTIAYGYLASNGLFNYYEGATTITGTGQKVIKAINSKIQNYGGELIRTDTDGTIYIPPARYAGSPEKEYELINLLNQELHEVIDIEGIRVGVDGRYKGMFAVDGKSYALLTYDDKIVKKGDTLKGRSKEQFVLKFINDFVYHILHKEYDKIDDLYFKWKKRIGQRKMTAQDVMQAAEIKISLKEYQHRVSKPTGKGGRSRAAAYELALQSDKRIEVGDRIEYYITQPKMNMRLLKNGKIKVTEPRLAKFETADLIENFNPKKINVRDYQKRLETIAKSLYMLVYSKEYIQERFGWDIVRLKDDREAYLKVSPYIKKLIR